MHMMGESSNAPVMGGIVPTSLEMAIALLPVYPVRHGFDGIRSANNKFERFEKVSVGQQAKGETDVPPHRDVHAPWRS